MHYSILTFNIMFIIAESRVRAQGSLTLALNSAETFAFTPEVSVHT